MRRTMKPSRQCLRVEMLFMNVQRRKRLDVYRIGSLGSGCIVTISVFFSRPDLTSLLRVA